MTIDGGLAQIADGKRILSLPRHQRERMIGALHQINNGHNHTSHAGCASSRDAANLLTILIGDYNLVLF
jgi:hypothetical protein